MNRKLMDWFDTAGVDVELWFTTVDPNGIITAPAGSLAMGPTGHYGGQGGTVWSYLQEAFVRTDLTSTEIIAATAFTAGTIVWSSAVDTRDFSEISVWFNPTALGSNTEVELYAQWSDDGATIPFDDNNGIQQTDFLVATGTDGSFKPKDYVATLTTATGELVANSIKMLSFPKKGGSFRFGVKGDSATGSFSARSQRLA